MSRYVDLSEKVTATYYDEQYEEWTQQTVTVADVLDSVCDDYTVLVLPSAQPEIIRCKDCVYWDSLPSSSAPEYHECVKRPFHINTIAEDFCSRAERRQK